MIQLPPKLIKAISQCPVLSAQERIIILSLLYHAKDINKPIDVSTKTFSKASGTTYRNALRVCKDLDSLGVIVIHQNPETKLFTYEVKLEFFVDRNLQAQIAVKRREIIEHKRDKKLAKKQEKTDEYDRQV